MALGTKSCHHDQSCLAGRNLVGLPTFSWVETVHKSLDSTVCLAQRPFTCIGNAKSAMFVFHKSSAINSESRHQETQSLVDVSNIACRLCTAGRNFENMRVVLSHAFRLDSTQSVDFSK